jgi:hypothetical protein
MFRNRWGRSRPDWRRRPSFGGTFVGGLIAGAASELGANLIDAAMGGEAEPVAPQQAQATPPAVAPVVVNVNVPATVAPTPTPSANTQ